MKIKSSSGQRLVSIVPFVIAALSVGNPSRAWSAPVAADPQRVAIGTFSLAVNRDWRVLDSEATRAILQARSRSTDGDACPGRLVLTAGQPFFKASAPDLPSYQAAWGKLILVSPDAKFSGYATTPQEHGLALFENRLRIEYWCLKDLQAIERISESSDARK